MTRQHRYTFMDEGKPRLIEVLFWVAVILMLLLALGAFMGGVR